MIPRIDIGSSDVELQRQIRDRSARLASEVPNPYARPNSHKITHRNYLRSRALVHEMRRSAVRTFERAGGPRSVALSIVGHKTESIYRRYGIVDEAMQREAAARLDAWMAGPPTAPSTATVTALRRGSRLRGRVTGESGHRIGAGRGLMLDAALVVDLSTLSG
jgi:hypothetical protein